MQVGADEATPLVYDGVMYLPSPSGIQAVDAATGEFIWELKRSGVAAQSRRFGEYIRGYGRRPFDCGERNTGKVAGSKRSLIRSRAPNSSGPIIAKGVSWPA